jgi:cell wall-associated NlpC family hydrolase
MHRYSCHRLLGVVGAMAAVLAVTLSVAAHPASADTLLEQKQHRLDHVRAQVHRLDARSERLTEQYDRAVWRLGVLHKQIIRNTKALHAAQAKLVHDRGVLASLLISQYKDGNTQVIAIVLGARSLSQVTNAVELKSRADTAISDTVQQIHRLRDSIALRRTQLFRERKQVRHQKAVIDARRTEIEKMLKQRRALVKELGLEVNVIKGAATIGQAQLALTARKWIQADQKLNRDDPGRILRDQVVLEGLQQIGVPYVWGGASPAGFDCSGLVMWLWAKHGLALPHFAAAQYGLGPVVEQGPVLDETKLQIGDLLFFHKLGHVGIYVGNGLLLHAPHTGDVVRLESLAQPWFTDTFVGATRPGPG